MVMSYFLLSRNRQNDELDLITRVVYDSQQEALRALSLELSRPEFQHDGFDFCIGYMDATIPVLVVFPAAPEEHLPPEPPEPLLVPVPPQPLVTPLQDSPVPYEESDAILEKIIEQSEAEGIKAPESVVFAVDSWPWESDAKTIEATEPLSEAVQEESDAAYVFDPLEEPSVDSDALLPGKAKVSVLEDLTIVTPGSLDSNMEASQPIFAKEPSAPRPDPQCADCVYVSTCPNKEGADPVTCGNFQWKVV